MHTAAHLTSPTAKLMDSNMHVFRLWVYTMLLKLWFSLISPNSTLHTLVYPTLFHFVLTFSCGKSNTDNMMQQTHHAFRLWIYTMLLTPWFALVSPNSILGTLIYPTLFHFILAFSCGKSDTDKMMHQTMCQRLLWILGIKAICDLYGQQVNGSTVGHDIVGCICVVCRECFRFWSGLVEQVSYGGYFTPNVIQQSYGGRILG